MKKMAVVLIMAVGFCFVLTSLVQATDTATGQQWARKNLRNKKKLTSIPIWQISENGTHKSITWVDHTPNTRFAVYDPGTPGDETDDAVLDKETGLVWERSPNADIVTNWDLAIDTAFDKYLAGRLGWRLPTIEEFASLVDRTQNNPALPSGHPFLNIQQSPAQTHYWSSTTYPADTNMAYFITFVGGTVDYDNKYAGAQVRVWCVRGGTGHDTY